MRGRRRRAAFALLLLSLCVPAMHVSAEAGGGQAEYTVEYIARDQGGGDPAGKGDLPGTGGKKGKCSSQGF